MFSRHDNVTIVSHRFELGSDDIRWHYMTIQLGEYTDELIMLGAPKSDESLQMERVYKEYPVGSKHTFRSIALTPKKRDVIIARNNNGHHYAVGIHSDRFDDLCGTVFFATAWLRAGVGPVENEIILTARAMLARGCTQPEVSKFLSRYFDTVFTTEQFYIPVPFQWEYAIEA